MPVLLRATCPKPVQAVEASAVLIVLPWPPTVNSYWRSIPGRVLISAEGRRYRQAVADLAAEHGWPKFGAARLAVGIDAWPPDRRRRDLDNILKSLLDALTHAGVWDDDSQIDRLCITRNPIIGGMVKVTISEAEMNTSPERV
jgi:crossover junction endodeoxyribonuclease RusA